MTERNPKAADNLAAWSIRDLKQIVQQFKDSQATSETKNESKIARFDSNRSSSSSPEKTKRATMIQSFDSSASQGEDFYETIKCQPVENMLFIQGNLRIKIPSSNKKDGGIFEKSYISYMVETPALEVMVERRYN